MSTSSSGSCAHSHMRVTQSPAAPCAGKSGFTAVTTPKLLAATTLSGRIDSQSVGSDRAKRRRDSKTVTSSAVVLHHVPPATTYPAPLVLPHDDLFDDPKYPLQSLRAWFRLKERNAVTADRRTIYVIPGPASSVETETTRWTIPGSASSYRARRSTPPTAETIIPYISAFYSGLPVKLLDASLRYVPWESDRPRRPQNRPKTNEKFVIGVESPTLNQLFGVHHRADPTKTFPRQVALDDLLDIASELLPSDAYAVIMLVAQDLYEGDDDDFCVGRAYGASRISIVSTARYGLVDNGNSAFQKEHEWPLSHCAEFVNTSCSEFLPQSTRRAEIATTNNAVLPVTEATPLGAAILAASAFRRMTTDNTATVSQRSAPAFSDADAYLFAVCRTVSHELGHCFGLDHCGYYACVMQGTASLAEDVRQPPYLCPICFKKLSASTNATEMDWLRGMCSISQDKDGVGWTGFERWCSVRMKALETCDDANQNG